jgi:hypothetical protein
VEAPLVQALPKDFESRSDSAAVVNLWVQVADSCISRECFVYPLSQFVETSMGEFDADTAGIVVEVEIVVPIDSHMTAGKSVLAAVSAAGVAAERHCHRILVDTAAVVIEPLDSGRNFVVLSQSVENMDSIGS